MTYTNEQIALMKKYGLPNCQRFDGLSIPPVCAVKPLINSKCTPCTRSASRNSALFSVERRQVQDNLKRQEHANLVVVRDDLAQLGRVQDEEIARLKAGIAQKKAERDSYKRHQNQQQ
jgi:hypothetical protein